MLIGGKRYNIHQQHIINNVITMTDATNSTIDFFIVVSLFLFEGFITVLSVFNTKISDGNYFQQKPVLATKRTQTELNKMLKRELVDLVIAYQ